MAHSSFTTRLAPLTFAALTLTTLVGVPAPSPVSAASIGDGCAAVNPSAITSAPEPLPSTIYAADGGEVGMLPPAQAYSAQGKYAKKAFRQILLGDLETGVETVIYEFDGPANDYIGGMRFSPDGQHLAFVAGTAFSGGVASLRVLDLAGNETLVTPFDVDETNFDFSPDSSTIAYIERVAGGNGSDIWTAPIDGVGAPTLIVDYVQPAFSLPPFSPPKNAAFIQWSPDGTRLAYQARNGLSGDAPGGTLQPGSPELYVVNANGSGLRQLNTPFEDGRESQQYTPAWSPDGAQLAFGQIVQSSTNSALNRRSIALYDLANDTVTSIPGSEGLEVASQWARIEWSGATDSIVFAGSRFAGESAFSDVENGVWSMPVDGGSPTQLDALDMAFLDSDYFSGLIPCSLVPPSSFAGLSPARIMDTREGLGVRVGPVGAKETVSLDVTGVGGVPTSGVEAVALNVTVARTTAQSFLTVFPDGVAQPTASNMNWKAGGAPTASSVIVKVGADGRVNFFNNAGSADVIVDVAGWFETGAGFEAVTPTRLLDTRQPLGVPSAERLDRGSITLQIHGAVVPEAAVGVVLNVTAPSATRRSFVSVYPSGGERPSTSNLNLVPGTTASNLVITQIGADGKVVLENPNGASHLIADVAGYLLEGSGFVGQQPTRLLDTRDSSPVGPSAIRGVPIRNVDNGVPRSARVAIVNVTAVAGTARSFFTVYPGIARPTASNLNFEAGQNVANLVLATIAPDGSITIFNNRGRTHAIVDVLGYFE
ncbi:MAG: TolB family protein [Ilumatobacter sp.]